MVQDWLRLRAIATPSSRLRCSVSRAVPVTRSACTRPRGRWRRPPSLAIRARLIISDCFISQGQQFPQDFKRAAELFVIASEAGNTEAQYALATMYKEGQGAPKDIGKAMRLMQQASVGGNRRCDG